MTNQTVVILPFSCCQTCHEGFKGVLASIMHFDLCFAFSVHCGSSLNCIASERAPELREQFIKPGEASLCEARRSKIVLDTFLYSKIRTYHLVTIVNIHLVCKTGWFSLCVPVVEL